MRNSEPSLSSIFPRPVLESVPESFCALFYLLTPKSDSYSVLQHYFLVSPAGLSERISKSDLFYLQGKSSSTNMGLPAACTCA